MIDKIVGVIDLKNGVAVHAVAGHRDQYKPIAWCDGSPRKLADHYRQLGLSRLYVADLDSILGCSVSCYSLIEIANHFAGDEVLFDVGWRGSDDQQRHSIESICDQTHAVKFIAATESARSVSAIGELCDLIRPEHVFLGYDLCDGVLVNNTASEAEWLRTAIESKLRGIIVLDLRRVGTRSGPVTAPICQRIKRECSSQLIYSGGGVRSFADVGMLVEAGCDGCLVGTMLHPH